MNLYIYIIYIFRIYIYRLFDISVYIYDKFIPIITATLSPYTDHLYYLNIEKNHTADGTLSSTVKLVKFAIDTEEFSEIPLNHSFHFPTSIQVRMRSNRYV